MLYQLSYFRATLKLATPKPTVLVFGAESQIRTGDTAIFSRVLYQLSYLGPATAVRLFCHVVVGCGTFTSHGPYPGTVGATFLVAEPSM